MLKIEEFKETLSKTSPVPCEYSLGDKVSFTNDYGVTFTNLSVIGFEEKIDPNWRPESFIYLDFDCYWYPIKPEQLTME